MQTENKSTIEPITVEKMHISKEKQTASGSLSPELYRHISIVVREVEKRYREGIMAYIDVLARYEEEIGELNHKLSAAKAAAAPEEAKLSMLTEEVRIEERLLEHLNSEFMQNITAYEVFQNEYSPLIEAESTKLIKRSKEGEIGRLNDEIEEGEMKLLSLELERLNQIEKLEPIRSEIADIEHALAELECKKRDFEMRHLQQISLQAYPNGALAASSQELSGKDSES